MIQRYLGNKSPLTPKIVDTVSELAEPGDLVVDAFSGTLAVSFALQKAGFEVAANDINLFSWVYAKGFLENERIPVPSGAKAVKDVELEEAWAEIVGLLTEPLSEIPKSFQRTDIYDHYCEAGDKSWFVSKRGSVGRRRFFTAENAKLIDNALCRLRWWHVSRQIDETTRCILTAALLDAVERISNTQGTYHDFPRREYDPRAFKRLELKAPSRSDFFGPACRFFGKAEDSIEFVGCLPRHKVLYLDPPYNFRQYTSYYFMLNMLARYPEIQDLDAYFANVKYVRGQNMSDDFQSPFSSRATFVPALERLVQRANTEYVVMSYFDGRNHWGEFKSEADRQGYKVLTSFFQSDLFVEGSSQCIPSARLNYQSYGGYKARDIQEFLFVAKTKPIEQGLRAAS